MIGIQKRHIAQIFQSRPKRLNELTPAAMFGQKTIFKWIRRSFILLFVCPQGLVPEFFTGFVIFLTVNATFRKQDKSIESLIEFFLNFAAQLLVRHSFAQTN